MPHLTLEYTHHIKNAAWQDYLLKLNGILLASGEFGPTDIKSRALPLKDVVVGLSPNEHAFVHLSLQLLSGRSEQVKQNLSKSLVAGLQDIAWETDAQSLQLSVNLVDMDRTCYSKAVVAR